MKTRRTFKFKLYQTKRLKHLHGQVIAACAIYNHCIALHKRYYSLFKKSLNKFKLQKHLTKLKKKHPRWLGLNSQAIQDITDRIERGYALFFNNLKAGIKTAPPKFKSRFKYKSFTLKQSGWKVSGNKLKIGKVPFKFAKSRELSGRVKTVTLKRNALGEFFVLFSVELDEPPMARTTTGKSVGLDFGLKNYLTDDAGNIVKAPEFLKGAMKKLKKHSKALSLKKKGSNNRTKARLSLARLHETISNKRLDFQHKLARSFALQYDSIFVEDLNLGEMKKRWGRKVSDLAFNQFLLLLEHHCSKAGSKLEKVPRYFPSSKTCHTCGTIEQGLSLKDRTWVCSVCSTQHNRDINAAKNILRAGSNGLCSKGVRALTPRRVGVRETQVSCPC